MLTTVTIRMRLRDWRAVIRLVRLRRRRAYKEKNFHFLLKLFPKKICFFCQHIQQIHGTFQDTIIDSLPTLSACGITLLLLALENDNGYREVKCHSICDHIFVLHVKITVTSKNKHLNSSLICFVPNKIQNHCCVLEVEENNLLCFPCWVQNKEAMMMFWSQNVFKEREKRKFMRAEYVLEEQNSVMLNFSGP